MQVPGIPRLAIALTTTVCVLHMQAETAFAQDTGTVLGTVLDATSLDPLEGARVEFLEQDVSAVTDAEGRFVFADVPVGDVTLRALSGGYGTVVESLPVTMLEVALIQFQLPRIEVLLDAILVRVGGKERSRGHSEALVEGGTSASLTAADLVAHKVPGLVVTRGASGAGARIRIRGVSSISGGNAPAIYLDGVRIVDRSSTLRGSGGPLPFHALEQIPASEVRQIRVLRGPAASAQYAEASNGVILIETRRGAPNPRKPR